MSNQTFQLPAFAKINLYLRILGKRSDGFHEIETIFQTVSLCDRLSFKESDQIVLTCNDAQIPTNESNLIVRAARLLQKRYGTKRGALVHLEKNIPAPGGLGGGSSDAAIALLGLAKLWNIKPRFEELCETGAELGADVPFFLYGGTAFGSGRGTTLSRIEDEYTEKFLLIVTPNACVSTAFAYAQVKARNLTNFSSKSILQICRETGEKLDLQQLSLKNDFEAIVFNIEPEVRRVKEKLLEIGASRALMSGSGASVFGIFDNENLRQAALRLLEAERGWRKFAVSPVSSQEYRKFLAPCADFLPKVF